MDKVGDSSNPRGPAGRPGGESRETLQLKLKALLSDGEAAARRGQRGEARRLFREALALEPTNEHAWLWLAFLAPSPRQSLAYLQQVRAYHPHSSRVREATAWAQERLAEAEKASAPAGQPVQAQARPAVAAPAPQQPGPERAMARPQAEAAPPRRSRSLALPLALCGLLLVGVAGIYTLWVRSGASPAAAPPAQAADSDMAALREQANQAIAAQDWAKVIPILERMYELAPDDEGARQQLAIAHLRAGLQLVEQDRLDQAIAHYDEAIRFYANDMDLQAARRLAIGYRDGRAMLAARHWDEAVALLTPVYQAAPGLRDVAELLFTAHFERARAFDAAGRLMEAREAYAQAAAIRPDDEHAQRRLVQLTAQLTPPTPTPTPRPRKRIEVDVSDQHLRGFENGTLAFDWLCSTGIATMPTRYGDFQVLDKIPEAWSSAWGLRMPYWLGIYWAGGSENGIHALPILRDGNTLWAGYLGRPVSFGCIVLDTANAAELYEWAEIGTPVTIVP